MKTNKTILTDLGRDAFLTELQRYHDVVSIAHQRRLFPGFEANATL